MFLGNLLNVNPTLSVFGRYDSIIGNSSGLLQLTDTYTHFEHLNRIYPSQLQTKNTVKQCFLDLDNRIIMELAFFRFVRAH